MRWISIKAAARELDVHTKTVRRNINAGIYQSKKGNGLVLVCIDDPKEDQKIVTKKIRTFLFELYDDMSHLKDRCFAHIEYEKTFDHLLDSVPTLQSRPKARDWGCLYLRIEHYYVGVEKMYEDKKNR